MKLGRGEPIRVLLAASEVVGFAKTGGLADVAGALPAALARRGHSCAVFLPLYHCTRHAPTPLERTEHTFQVPIAGRPVQGRLYCSTLGDSGVPVYLVEQPDYFERDDPALGRGLYQFTPPAGRPRDYPDNCERFAFFCRAVLEAVRLLDLRPDVLHLHDWQTGLVPVYLREHYRRLGAPYLPIRTLFTIHNIAYQGIFPPDDLPTTGLGWHLFNPGQLEFYGYLSLLKAGIVFADRINTVSPTYAREIETPYYGLGMHGILAERRDRFCGIVNGADYRAWNPAADPFLASPYDADHLTPGKPRCKADLQTRAGLAVEPMAPLLGIVSRLTEQKGIDLVIRVAPHLLEQGAQLVVLGEGDPDHRRQLEGLRDRFPGRVSLTFAFDEPLAHRIEAGADLFLMPSLYEPSGLNQLYSMRYGTPPVVRATGGLADTVVDTTPATLAAGTATGFTFLACTPDALREAVQRALALHREQGPSWHQVVTTAMRQDWSWDRSAAAYEQVMERISIPY